MVYTSLRIKSLLYGKQLYGKHACEITLVGAFVSLVFVLCWKQANIQGALLPNVINNQFHSRTQT